MTMNHNENADALLIRQNILHCSLFYCMKALSTAAKSSKFTSIMLGINSTCRNHGRNDTLIAAASIILNNMRIIIVFLNHVSCSIQIS